ncbi:M1 family aminopeptidase [Blastococcus saxobsidens]|uniref:Peptidase M1-like protein n=1 Tax=Blastococcus saxobsidens TaxID=138336 RepID=A0A4Q7YAS8_9ACTN|nr:M1 family aminopeptidase [Blastococcus saxobsidens]RZU33239.1 peptidase M1-like protein [Blastococcus saxobsidens]
MTGGRPLGALVAVLLLAGCTSFADATPDPGAAAPTTAPAPPAVPDPTVCPAERAAPDPARPAIDYVFRLSDDLRTVTGSETVVFTPDVPTDELVFRLVPNAPESAPAGHRLTVDRVSGSDVDDGAYEDAGGAAPGGLYVVRLSEELDAGESTEVRLDFTLTVGAGGFERFGVTEGITWWASGAPLLAWEPGEEWARDPFVGLTGETAVSPAADTTVTVSAPEALTVLMSGRQVPPSEPRQGRRTWRSTEPVARDVAVAAGLFGTAERETTGGVLVRAGALAGGDLEPAQLLDDTITAIAELEEFLGPFPYGTLTVALLPDYGGGIEYPSFILQATPSREVLVHEVAHMWFYGMVGNSQFRDPWLDEAFATWAEAVPGPPPAQVLDALLGSDGAVGAAMDGFDGDGPYVRTVYGKGGAALLAAREAAGAEAFDAAVRCYLDATAWSIATPEDVGAALAALPAAVDVLVRAGALDEDDLPR